jgi:hypothetical protein
MVKLMPPQYVKPYVKTNKNDAADAEAICEAVTRPNMHFVPIKSAHGILSKCSWNGVQVFTEWCSSVGQNDVQVFLESVSKCCRNTQR